MATFDSESIRNIGIVGHGDAGKTSLASAMLFSSGAASRLGRVEEGNTLTDYDEDEIARQITISSAVAHCHWKGHKINLVDTPGYSAFVFDAKTALLGVETALVVVDAVEGVEVQTRQVWRFAEELGLARAIVLSKMGRDRASLQRSLRSLRETFGRSVVPVQLPIGQESEFKGVVDLISGKAYAGPADGSGDFKEVEVPEDLKDAARQMREELVEMIAESDDDLMERFFEEGTLSEEEVTAGLGRSMAKGLIFPVFCVSSTHNTGVKQLLDQIVNLFPNPLQRKPFAAVTAKGEPAEIIPSKEGPLAVYAFKTFADPFAGRINVLRVISGTLKSDNSLKNLTQDQSERFGSLQVFQGKSHESVSELRAGDIGGVLKLKDTRTGDTLGDPTLKARVKEVKLPEPAISFAVEPRTRGDEDKIGAAIAKVLEEDPSLEFRRDPQTQQFLLAGTGQLHIEVVVNRLKQRFGVEVDLKPPKVPYRETIMGTADVQGKHKKQTGGHGQFGECKIKMEPRERGEGYKFEDKIFGGSIPKGYIPAVDKGIQETAARGYLAGFPMVDFKVTLYDGSYHNVDSSEMAFKIAGSIAFKKAMDTARPVVIEPIMNIEVYVPEEFSGDVMGDLNSRRGKIQGMDVKGTTQVVQAQVPFAEMLNYAPVLTSLTGGRGSYHMENSHYEVVPSHLIEKIISEANKDDD